VQVRAGKWRRRQLGVVAVLDPARFVIVSHDALLKPVDG